ncbi:MAG: thioredoxin [Propionibacteriaceae bacterium]|jgi:thioredoxin 1|nr:thioredoxin [Propionibacteriaceae bacterium]
MATIQPVSDATFEALVLQSASPVLVDFWAAWCSPCKQLAPIVEELAGEYAGKVTFLSMDIDANDATPMNLGISSIPTLILFKDGAPAKVLVGAKPKGAIARELDAVL